MKAIDIPSAVRKKVYVRDGMRCQLCGGRSGLHIHHIFYRSQFRNGHELYNLVLLCERCHREVHIDKHRWQPYLLKVVGGEDWFSKIDKGSVPEHIRRCMELYNEKNTGQKWVIEL